MSEHTGRTLSTGGTKKIDLSSKTIYILAVSLFLLLSIATTTFFSKENLYALVLDVSIQFYVAIGFTFLLIMGEIDMSVGAMFGFSGALAGYFYVILDMPFSASFLLAALVSAGMGLINGLLVIRFRVNSMMVTIGMMTVLQGLKAVLIDKLATRTFTGSFRGFMRFKIAGIHWTIIAFMVILVVLELYLQRGSMFRKLYYVGQNVETAKIYGIKANKVKLSMFVLSALTAGIGGIISASRVGHAASTAGGGLEFTMITAAVLGGASLFGGKGSILRSSVGLIFLAMITNGMISFAIDPYIQQIALGVILIIAVTMDVMFTKKNYTN